MSFNDLEEGLAFENIVGKGEDAGNQDFYAPSSIDWWHIVFGLSVCPFVHMFVCLSAESFTLAIAFEWLVIQLSYFIYIFFGVKPFL